MYTPYCSLQNYTWTYSNIHQPTISAEATAIDKSVNPQDEAYKHENA